MRRTESGQYVANIIAELGASVVFAELGDSAVRWDDTPRRLSVDSDYRGANPHVIAYQIMWPAFSLDAVVDWGGPDDWDSCMVVETVVKKWQAVYWFAVYGENGKQGRDLTLTEKWGNYWVQAQNTLGTEHFDKIIWVDSFHREHCEYYGEPPQEIDPELADAFQTAMLNGDTEIGIAAVGVIMEAGTDVVFGSLEKNVYGQYSSYYSRITIDESLRGYPMALAATLIHEAYHAQEDMRRGGQPQETAAACLQEEIDAFRIEAEWWYEEFGRRGKRNPARVERVNNSLLRAWINNDMKEWVLLSEGYQEQCLGGVLN